MATDQNNTTGQNGMGNGSSGMNGGGMSPDTWKMRNSQGISRFGVMGESMQGGEDVKAKLEHHAKMKKYKEKHDKAVEVFQRIAGTTVTTREGAISTLAQIMARGNAKEKAEAIMAAGDFCWACNEKDAEDDVGEEVETLSRLMRG